MDEDNKHHASLGKRKRSCKPSVNDAQQFTSEDVINYLNEFRLAQSEKYDTFVNIMKDFKALRIDSTKVVGRVNELLKGNPDLNQKFSRLFPKSNESAPKFKKEPLPGIVVTYDNALGLTRSIMERFHRSDNQDFLKYFMDILGLFLKGKKTLNEISKEVPLLFKDHPDLVHKFCTFLHVSSEEIKSLRDDDMYLNPKSDGTSGVVETTRNDASKYIREVKATFSFEEEKFNKFLDVMKDYKDGRVDAADVAGRVKELFKGHSNLITRFNTFLPKGHEISLTDEEAAPQKMTVEFEEAISFVNKIKIRFMGSHRVYKAFLRILNMYRKEQHNITEVYQEVATLFKDHPDLLDEFTRFLPDTPATTPVQPSNKRKYGFGGISDMTVCDDKDSLEGIFNECAFFEKVQERLRCKDYQSFLKCLAIYSKKIISKKELQILVRDLLGKYPDLMEGFNEFLRRCERTDGFLAGVMGKKSLWNEPSYETTSSAMISLLVLVGIQVQPYNIFCFMLSKFYRQTSFL